MVLPFLILVLLLYILTCSTMIKTNPPVTCISFQQCMVLIDELYSGGAKRSGYRRKGNSSTKIETRNLADMASTIWDFWPGNKDRFNDQSYKQSFLFVRLAIPQRTLMQDQQYVQWPVIREQFFSVWDRDHQFFSENRYKKDSWLQIKEMFIDQWYKLSFSDQNTFQRPMIEEEFFSLQPPKNC